MRRTRTNGTRRTNRRRTSSTRRSTPTQTPSTARPSPQSSTDSNSTVSSPANSTPSKTTNFIKWIDNRKKDLTIMKPRKKKSRSRDTVTVRQHRNRSNARGSVEPRTQRRPSTKKTKRTQPPMETDDNSDSVAFTTENTVEEMTGAGRAADDEDPLKKIFSRAIDNIPPAERVFHPLLAADRVEPANLEHRCHYKNIQFSPMQTVYLTECKPQRTHNHTMKSRSDEWRRFGALKTIHNIGGWTFEAGRRKKDRKMKLVRSGQSLSEPTPKMKPILTFEELMSRPYYTPGVNSSVQSVNTSVPDRLERATEDTVVVDEEVSTSGRASATEQPAKRKSKKPNRL
ncbi:hypothetical protein M3Y96_00148100 [Aphelenchoides besseyi]|nr:hypothetical protein M3Y96_00148100 [Aphelenchoides besseyi]